jgi:hypothetical protein
METQRERHHKPTISGFCVEIIIIIIIIII